ncbi:MAG: UDP-N-acetylmuramoyl-L-alanyl-D-glutamate--2,6-diaminopimelate ligase [Bacteroidota bacterium]
MFQTVFGQMVQTHEVHISKIEYDSRKIERGDLFVAIRGTSIDGHQHIKQAISKGAKAIVLEDDEVLADAYFMHEGVVKIVVGNTRRAMAVMARNYFGNPASKLKLIGVTGTNGKTTTSHLIKAILEANGEKVGLIGTIAYIIGKKEIPATHTTPESLELDQYLAGMVQQGCTSAVMEVSSHSLVQYRVYGIQFHAGVFTNLTQDHLDFHRTMEQYATAKKRLFDSLDTSAIAVVNADDPEAGYMVSSTQAKVMTYGIGEPVDVKAIDIQLGIDRTLYTVKLEHGSITVISPLIGRFNVSNTLAAIATGIGIGIKPDVIKRGIEAQHTIRGRFERIRSPQGWTAVIDYAHTPDALEKCLLTIHDILPEHRTNRIITLFGAGGDRDRTKRPIMGKIAAELSDVVIVTSDNPRTENREAIIDDIMSGIPPGKKVTREADRKQAIVMALSQANPGDVVLLAGKGHENYQVVGREKIPFDDREEVLQFLKSSQSQKT